MPILNETKKNKGQNVYRFMCPDEYSHTPNAKVPVHAVWEGLKERSTSHGIPHIDTAQGKLKRGIWCLITLITIGVLIFNLEEIIRKFAKKNVSVIVTLNHAKQQKFPAVTLCNMNPFKKSSLQQNSGISNLLGVTNSGPSRRRKRSITVSSCTCDNYHVDSGYCFAMNSESKTDKWKDGSKECKSGWEPAILDTESKYNFIRDNAYIFTGLSNSKQKYWIDGKEKGGKWKWDSTDVEFTFTAWKTNIGNEKCVAGDRTDGHKWETEHCDEKHLFLCQKQQAEPAGCNFAVATTTDTPTTEAQTTIAPTTEAQTTIAPTTEAQTTIAPTTDAQTTIAPTTEAQTTIAPTTEAQTTISPTTEAQTTIAPTTETQTTITPTTEAQTTITPTTEAQTTIAHTTEAQTTIAPTTEAKTTIAHTTEAQTTIAPTTEAKTTIAPTTEAETTIAPTTEVHTTIAPTTEAQSTITPTTEAQTTIAPTTEAQTTIAPTTEAQTTLTPKTEAQTSITPTTVGITTFQDTTVPISTEKPTTTIPSLTTVIPPTIPPPVPVAGSAFPERIQSIKEFSQEEKTLEILANIPEHEKKSLGYKSSDFIVDCQYAGYNCDHSQFSYFYNSVHGNCYVFNSGWNTSHVVKWSDQLGPRYGLKVVLNINQDEYIEQFGSASGVRIVVHSQEKMPFPEDEGVMAKTGYLTSISISKVSIKKKGLPYTECVQKENKDLKLNVFEEHYPVGYSTLSCFKTCYQYYVISECGCADPGYPSYGAAFDYVNVKACNSSNIKEDDCRYNITKLYADNELNCNCKDPCVEDVFIPELSESRWPSDMSKDFFISRHYDQLHSIVSSNDTEKLRENLAKVEVYFREFDFEKIEEKPSYSDQSFMTDIGGSLGLWIGWSFITAFEFMEFFIDLCVLVFTRKCSEKVKNSENESSMSQYDNNMPKQYKLPRRSMNYIHQDTSAEQLVHLHRIHRAQMSAVIETHSEVSSSESSADSPVNKRNKSVLIPKHHNRSSYNNQGRMAVPSWD